MAMIVDALVRGGVVRRTALELPVGTRVGVRFADDARQYEAYIAGMAETYVELVGLREIGGGILVERGPMARGVHRCAWDAVAWLEVIGLVELDAERAPSPLVTGAFGWCYLRA
jgi:hypothetical protein